MNTASEVVPTSLAQRIAKVRNCMLVEALTGISPTEGDLFASLCQTYEQQNAGTSCSATWPISLVTSQADFEDFTDWNDGGPRL